MSGKGCKIHINTEHHRYSFVPEEGKVNNIDPDLLSHIAFLILEGQTVSDIVVKVAHWSKVRGMWI